MKFFLSEKNYSPVVPFQSCSSSLILFFIINYYYIENNPELIT